MTTTTTTKLGQEELLSLSQAAALLPPGRQGKPTHQATMMRWIKNGVLVPGGGRVRLEAVRLGGRWVTSAAAVARFINALTVNQKLPSP